MSFDADRFFVNPWRTEAEDISETTGSTLLDNLQPKIQESVETLLQSLEGHVTLFTHDYSVYTGTCGFALLFLKIGKSRGNRTYIQKAFDLIHTQRRVLKNKQCTFLTGDAGPLAIAAVAAQALGLSKESTFYVAALENLCDEQDILDLSSDLPNELLYGRAGYLYALLYVEKELGRTTVSRKLIGKVANAILDGGRLSARSGQSSVGLYYEWHGKCYLAAAHGYSGILYLLLQVQQNYPGLIDDEGSRSIQSTIEHLLSHRLPSGNFPSSLNNKQDKLVQWCHGAPGVIHMLCDAAKVYEKPSYMKAAEDCAAVIWERGLLKKGYGICHGIAGNAYAFLRLYRATSKNQFLYYALRFAEFCCEYGKHGCRQADRPYSLFEGMAGTVYFLEDVLNSHTARFPAFEL